MHNKIIAGNWKMNKLPNEAIEYIEKIENLVKNSKNEIILFVPYIDLFYCMNFAQGTNIKIGAQNVHWEEKGAYTGEVSAQMLKSIEVEYVLVGHSERRQNFFETDEIINKKAKAVLNAGLKAVICIGETLEERETGKTNEVISMQTQNALRDITDLELENVILAYEPVWAIGTGRTASSEDANNSIKVVRKKIEELYGKVKAENIAILYGGSMKPSNSKELLSMSDIDGGLIGGASLVPEEFAEMANFEM